MDEAIQKTKKKRKYTKRGPVKLILDGKVYRGIGISTQGDRITLKTLDGWVAINTKLIAVVEVSGAPMIGPPEAYAPSPTGVPAIVGGMASFKAARDRQLEELQSLPRMNGES